MREQIRTFREFYPDPVRRHQTHYAFAHRFLPQYVQRNPFAFLSYVFRDIADGQSADPTRFIQSRWCMIFEDIAGSAGGVRLGMPTVFRRVSDLSMSTHHLVGRPAALIQMPKPEQPPEAFFVGVVLLADVNRPNDWPRDAQARVITLEMFSELNPSGGVLCEWTEDSHLNHGRHIASSPDGFLRAMGELLGAPEIRPHASFTPGIRSANSALVPPTQIMPQNLGVTASTSSRIETDPTLDPSHAAQQKSPP